MSILPIVDRELRVAARRGGTYWARLTAVAAVGLLFAANLSFFQAGRMLPSAQGRRLFESLSALAFIYCLFTGSRLTADCLSREKRDGTLRLLFLTSLGGIDVVLGKLVATSLNAVYGLLATIPLMALTLQLGGVNGLTVLLMTLVLLNTLFFSLSMGLWVSAHSQDARKAMFAAVLLILVATAGPFMISFIASMLGPGDPTERLWPLLTISPGFCFMSVFNPPPCPPVSFWISLVLLQGASWLALARASTLLPQFRQDVDRPGALARWQRDLDQKGYGEDSQRLRHRRALLSVNPFLWLAARNRWKPAYAWGFLGAAMMIWFWRYALDGSLVFAVEFQVVMVVLLHSFFKTWIVSESSLALNTDRHSRNLELLLSTPLTPRAIVRGQWRALGWQFAGPFLALLVLEWLVLRRTFSLVPILALTAMLATDLVAAGWAGMWFGLRCKDTAQAVGTALLVLLILPWAVFLILSQTFRPWLLDWLQQPGNRWLAWLTTPGLDDLEFQIKLYLWMMIGIVHNFVWGGLWCRIRLRRRFKAEALRHYDAPPPGGLLAWLR